MQTIQGLNTGEQRNLVDWSDRTVSAILSPATRDIRENEMVRRINAAPLPFMVQVGKAHIPGLINKGVVGTTYPNEADFVAKTSKKNKPDLYDTRIENDSITRRQMNFWGQEQLK